MVMIILSVCMVTAPQQCRDVTIPTMVDSASPLHVHDDGPDRSVEMGQRAPGLDIEELALRGGPLDCRSALKLPAEIIRIRLVAARVVASL